MKVKAASRCQSCHWVRAWNRISSVSSGIRRTTRLESCPTRGMDTATRPGGMSMLRKAPNEANWNRTSIACSERVNVDGCDHVYAKRTQFRVVEGGASKRWPCRKLARRDARLTGFGIWDYARSWHACGAEWDRRTWKLDSGCPPGAAGIVASGSEEWRLASGQ